MKLYSLSCIRTQRLHERLPWFPVGRHSYCPCSWLFIVGSLHPGKETTTTKNWVVMVGRLVGVSGREEAGRSPCNALLSVVPPPPPRWSQPGSRTLLLWEFGVWSSFSGFFSSLTFSLPFQLFHLFASKASLVTPHPHPSPLFSARLPCPLPLSPLAIRDALKAKVSQRTSVQQKTLSSVCYTLMPSFLIHILFLAARVLGEAALHKVENVRSTLTKIKTCWSLELQCQFCLLENPCLGQEAINQRCNHLHLAHYDMEPHY